VHVFVATDDYTPFLSVASAIKFVKLCGPEKIMVYNNQLAKDAGIPLLVGRTSTARPSCVRSNNACVHVIAAADELAKAWNTEVVVPPEDFAAMVRVIVLYACSHTSQPVS
jgi:hypothetical protein